MIFKRGLGTIQDDDYVSYHLYFVILWMWDAGPVSGALVHTLLTYIFERNILDVFTDDDLNLKISS